MTQEHLYRKFGKVYYGKNRSEIDVIAGEYKVEVKRVRPHRGYPRGVRVLGKEDIPMFIFEVYT